MSKVVKFCFTTDFEFYFYSKVTTNMVIDFTKTTKNNAICEPNSNSKMYQIEYILPNIQHIFVTL